MSTVCVLDGKYEPRVDGRLENIKRGVQSSLIFSKRPSTRGSYFLSRTHYG